MPVAVGDDISACGDGCLDVAAALDLDDQHTGIDTHARVRSGLAHAYDQHLVRIGRIDPDPSFHGVGRQTRRVLRPEAVVHAVELHVATRSQRQHRRRCFDVIDLDPDGGRRPHQDFFIAGLRADGGGIAVGAECARVVLIERPNEQGRHGSRDHRRRRQESKVRARRQNEAAGTVADSTHIEPIRSVDRPLPLTLRRCIGGISDDDQSIDGVVAVVRVGEGRAGKEGGNQLSRRIQIVVADIRDVVGPENAGTIIDR